VAAGVRSSQCARCTTRTRGTFTRYTEDDFSDLKDKLICKMKLILEQMDCRLLIVGKRYYDKQQYLDLIENEGLASYIRVVDQYR